MIMYAYTNDQQPVIVMITRSSPWSNLWILWTNGNSCMNEWNFQKFVHICTESEKPRQRVSNADRKVFANPESFCNKLIIGWRISGYFGKCPDTIQNIQIIYKVYRWTGKFPEDLKSVGMNCKVSKWCKKCLDNLKNVSGYFKKSLDDLKMYLDNLESFWMILKVAA